jgi:hypothetical protein
MTLRFRTALLLMRLWAFIEAHARRRYRLNQAEALHYKRRLDNRASVRAASASFSRP